MTTRAKFWLLTAAAVSAVLLTMALGHWQLSRAWEKEGLQLAIAAQSQAAPLDQRVLEQVADVPDSTKTSALIHRTATLRGTWLQNRTVYLDNRQMDAKPGFYVLTPMRLQGSDKAILVQRGWVPRNFQDRSKLPGVATPEGPVVIEGRIAAPPSKLVDLGEEGTGLIRQNLDMTAFAREIGLALLPVTLVQTRVEAGIQDGLVRNWPVPALGAAKNYGYAFQWFALSALIAGLYVWFQIGKHNVSKREN